MESLIRFEVYSQAPLPLQVQAPAAELFKKSYTASWVAHGGLALQWKSSPCTRMSYNLQWGPRFYDISMFVYVQKVTKVC